MGVPYDRRAYVVIGPSIGYVPLTQGKFALVDAHDVPALATHAWVAQKTANGTFYATRQTEGGRDTRRLITMHRALRWAPEGEEVDHANGNTLDNRLMANLRRCTKAQNQQNRKVRRDARSGLKGAQERVGPHGEKFYTSQIKGQYLGTFSTAGEANARYFEEAKRLYGEFARAA